MYLLDADVLIFAKNSYYPIDRVPQFWNWLRQQAANGKIKVPQEMYDEISEGNDNLFSWISDLSTQNSIILSDRVNRKSYNYVLENGYRVDPNAPEIEEKIRNDPFLIAYAWQGKQIGEDRIVVTREVSKPTKTGVNRKIPDVCESLGIRCITDVECYNELGFRVL